MTFKPLTLTYIKCDTSLYVIADTIDAYKSFTIIMSLVCFEVVDAFFSSHLTYIMN